MEPHVSTTPFGRRALSLAHVAAQISAKERELEASTHKWQIFRSICTAKDRIGVTERALSVLNALLTFYPETVLSGDNLVVFPSNDQLSLRAHGMAASTLRRHLAVLVDAGVIVRRDSPNGKRYARKGRGGDIELAFGFDLAPIVARADEFERLADEILAEDRALKLARERVSICRRDIAKMIETGLEAGIPTRRDGQGPADWQEVHLMFRAIINGIPRNAIRSRIERAAEELTLLADEVLNILELHVKAQNPSANESHSGRHKQNSNPEPLIEVEHRSRISDGANAEPEPETQRTPEKTYPLAMVLQACPDIADYAGGGIGNWRDLVATVAVVRPMLGISPSAWEDACTVMGELEAAIVLAAILQRGESISSAGGYLRSLTGRARSGEFSLGPVLMALLRKRKADPGSLRSA